MNPPVKVGDKLRVVIDALGVKGDGVAHINRFALIVKYPGLRPEQIVNVQVLRVLKRFAICELTV